MKVKEKRWNERNREKVGEICYGENKMRISMKAIV